MKVVILYSVLKCSRFKTKLIQGVCVMYVWAQVVDSFWPFAFLAECPSIVLVTYQMLCVLLGH